VTGSAGDERTIVTIDSERTLSRTQQTKIEIALPVEFRRSSLRRFQSAVLPLLVVGVLVAVLTYGHSGQYNRDFSFSVYYRYWPGLLVLLLAFGVLGFMFLHHVMNWLANLWQDYLGGASIHIDANGLTDRRVARHRIDWADVDKVDIVESRGGVAEVELVLKDGVRCQFRRFRLDFRIFNTTARRGKGTIVGIQVQYFDTDAYVIASVIEALVRRP
jgi:hypothetical protein